MAALGTFLIAFACSYAVTLILVRFRPNRAFLDVPNERSSHEAPKPRSGGVAIVLSFLAATVFLFVVAPATRTHAPLLLGTAMLFVAGLADDWKGVRVGIRFGIQIAAALVLVVSGRVIDHVYLPGAGVIPLGWAAVPLTCLFVVTSINFYNFIDGIDGLAAGSAFIATGFLALVAMMLGHAALSLLLVAAAGSALGFLQFNFPPSRLFMGDSGSTFLGYFVSYATIAGNRSVPEIPLFIPLFILSSLYMDAGLTLFNRLMKGENILKAHHTHYYQRLLSLGLNHKQVTLLEYGLVILLGTAAVVFFRSGGLFPAFLSVCWVVLFTVSILKIRGMERGDRLFWERRTFLVVATDLLLITAAYLGAYFLRMNFHFTRPEGIAVLRALPIVLVVRSACFFKFGLYRSLWRYTSTTDVVRILKAVTVGSAIVMAAVVLLYRFVAFPRAVIVIEYFLLLLFILGSRFSLRLFHEIGKEAHGENAERFAIIGAGDFGERIGRELRNDSSRSTAIACYIDDEPSKIGLTLHGVDIVGPISELNRICREREVGFIVVAIAGLPEATSAAIARVARSLGIAVETPAGIRTRRHETPAVLFDRLATSTGSATGAGDTADASFWRGRRVLLTCGGGRIGRSLSARLCELGAAVQVHLSSPGDAGRVAASAIDRIRVVGCGVAPGDLRAAVDSCGPDVVIHTVSPAALGPDTVGWHTLESTAAVRDALSSRRVDAALLVVDWAGAKTGDAAAEVSAAAETLWLRGGRGLEDRLNALRLPRVLDEASLLSIAHRVFAESPEPDFRLLEPAGAAAVLVAAVECGPCKLLTPTSHLSIDARECARRISAARAGVIGRDRRSASGGHLEDAGRGGDAIERGSTAAVRELIFPAESVEPLKGDLWRVDGPVTSAGSPMDRVLSGGFLNTDVSGRRECLRLVSACLYELKRSSAAAGGRTMGDPS